MNVQEGRLTYEEFVTACREFVDLQQAKKDGWKVLGNVDEFGGLFITISFLRGESRRMRFKDNKEEDEEEKVYENEGLLVGEEEVNPEQGGSNISGDFIQYRYDIVYSVSHSVPTLYFSISDKDGRQLSLEEVWKLFGLSDDDESQSSDVQPNSVQDVWNVISIQDHAILHTPFFFVHPCNNWAIMKECGGTLLGEMTSLQFLISWLSIVGNRFGLRLSPVYSSGNMMK